MLALSGSNNNNNGKSKQQASKQQDLASNFSAPASTANNVSASDSSAAVIPQQIKASSREMAKKAEEGLEQSVSNLVDISTKLEQDQMETGVDEKEWNEDE